METTLRRLRQKVPKFKVRLDYTARLCQGEGVGERDKGERNRKKGDDEREKSLSSHVS